MALAPGARFGPYEIVAPLGAGGMGEVYRAHDARLGRDIALKLLPETLAGWPERLARFEREARIVASLNHPNIVTLHSIEETEGTRFLTMELVEGRSLADLVRPGGLPLEQTLDLIIPIADALAAAHAKDIVHRDLKPANVMVTAAGLVKVLDFGLAKTTVDPERTAAASGSAPLSAVGEVLGTGPYMAPEQIFGEPVSAATDLFSLGILTFELLAGKRPFERPSFWGLALAIMQESPPRITSLRPDLPAEVERLVLRCLEKQPGDRYQSAVELADDARELRRALDQGTTTTVPGGGEALASIAVLPFLNRSSSPDDAYFSDGLADELLDLLAKIKGLRVSARASSFQFRDHQVAPAEVGRALNVATLLDGSVRRSGNQVRISVQLVNASDGYHLWSERYDRTIDDIFAVQDDIAQSVVTALRTTLLGEAADSGASGRVKAEVDQAARGRSSDPEAHRLHLLARHFMDQFSREATGKATDYLRQAVERDPGFALAWTDLSVAYVREIGWALVPAEEGYQRAREAVERSLLLEPSLADGHAQIAWLRIFRDWAWGDAQASLAQADRLAPGSASVLRLRGVLASVLGRPEEAITIFRRALELDPLSAAAYHSLGLALQVVDDLAGAADAFRRALELAPQRIATHAHLAVTALAQGLEAEAAAEAEREPEEGYRLWALAIVGDATRDSTRSEAALRALIETHAEGWAVQIAEVQAARGEVDAAFDWLDRACESRDAGLALVKTNPRLRSLHAEPRWAALLGRIGLPS
ncbi:MAG: protein kinase [Gemmatimonadales bacterium]